jgi:outer membrane protein OmpA-like peptidoglycan-associated protein
MNRSAMIGIAAIIAFFGVATPTFLARRWQNAASARLVQAEAEAASMAGSGEQVAVAAEADENYCTPQLRTILRRVLTSGGLIGASGRGCQPVQARSVATMSGDDFNALFLPMQGRGGIIQFDRDSADLEEIDTALLERVFADRQGASYFFVVSRASPEGNVEHNRDLSRARAEAVMAHLQNEFHDPELNQQVGLLWLGEEFAQLNPSFCDWTRSDGAGTCDPNTLNRSAFIAWIDCRL